MALHLTTLWNFSETQTKAILSETLTSICLGSLQFFMENTPSDILALTSGPDWALLTERDWLLEILEIA